MKIPAPKKILLFMIMAITICTAGCLGENFPENMPEDIKPNPFPSPKFEGANVDIYFDSTESMRGYTTLDADNIYRTLPYLLHDIGDSMGEVKFFKFGEKITPLQPHEYKNFTTEEPYNEIITEVHNVIEKSNPENLSIIITDLFENDADWSIITEKIRKKYFAKNLDVAVIGIKNPFQGKIFDVGLKKASFDYDSGSSPEKFRPFYLLVLGQSPAIQDFINRFKEKITSENEIGILLLSKNLIPTTTNFADNQELKLENFLTEDILKLDDAANYAEEIREFRVENFDSPASITSPLSNINYVNLNMDELQSEAKVYFAEQSVWKKFPKNDIKATLEQDGERFFVKIEMTPIKSLDKDTFNFVQVLISPTPKSFELPAWVEEWNMANVDSNLKNFDGAKTVNLKQMLSSLKNSFIEVKRPDLVNLKFVAHNQ
mgnify:CR=1 FL=1